MRLRHVSSSGGHGWLDASRGADGTWVEYAHSDGGSVTSITSVAGTTAYSLDAAKRWTHVAAPSAAFDFGYCEWNGRLAAVTNASGFVVQYAYDIMDRVTNISWRTTGGATLGGFAYEYDALGRITSRSHSLGTNAFDRAYAYDDFDRLASDGVVACTYDAAGNRMTRTEDGDTITYTLGVGDRLASWTGGSYTHDAAGNVTRIERDGRPTLDLAWNSQYQLVSVATNGAFAERYAYDALGRRVSTTTREETTRHVYDGNWQCIADINANGSVVASYTWGEGIDKLLDVTIGGATYYALTDIQGTVWGYVDSQNNVVASWQYDAWGNVISEYIVPSAAVLATLRYRFQGREWSAATGLTNFRMRWYDAETGRWISKDPIGLRGGLNLYVFCGNAPIGWDDPLGTAHIEFRPLDAGDDKEGQKRNNGLFTWNLPGDIDPRHAEIFFDDGKEPSHIGYGPSGIHSDNSKVPYPLRDATKYDDNLMRAAVKNLEQSGKWNPKGSSKGGYNFVFHNCQDFVSHAIEEHNRLKGGQ